MYEQFKILLDSPSKRPALGFENYANALSEIILQSHPRFAVGIFGTWGSGKTTLMEAIRSNVGHNPTVVPVEFNAWRYEKEEHLIVPLLDTLREALILWNKDHPTDPAVQKGIAIKAAATVAKAARALLAGLSVKAGIPGGPELALDASKVVADWRRDDPADPRIAEQPRSFYHASFTALRESLDDFTEKGKRRIVVFVDDLDRCLPLNALQVLESMKLFFDLDGFVFVVGLDQDVIERSIQLKYQAPNQVSTQGQGDSGGSTVKDVSAADYVKKIFQVPFSVPRITDEELDLFLNFVADSPDLPKGQADDLRKVVRRHLRHVVGDEPVNPREVKRLINAYTVQMKMLERKFGAAEQPKADVVLALQAMTFRVEWKDLYDLLATDPSVFVEALRDALSDDARRTELWLSAERVHLPQSFINYVNGVAAPLLQEPLARYVTSIESTRSTDQGVLDALRTVWQLRQVIGQLGTPGGPPMEARDLLQEKTRRLIENAKRLGNYPLAKDLAREANELKLLADQFLSEVTPDTPNADVANWQKRLQAKTTPIVTILEELRQRSTS
jgi:KAP family P-loop domain